MDVDCPACYLGEMRCCACGKKKDPGPCGVWGGDWWYCDWKCLERPRPAGTYCDRHREILVRLKLWDPSQCA